LMDKIRIRHFNEPDFDWLPDWFRFPPERLNLDYVPSDGARQRFGSPERLSYRDFIATIPLVSGKGKGGLSDPDRYPYQPHLLEILDHPAITDYTITAPNQSAKTTTIEDWIFYRATYDPVDINIYYPDEDTVTDKFSKSLRPKLKHKNLAHLITGVDDDLTQKLLSLASGMLIKAGWTSSLLKMSAFSAGICILEECDKNPDKIAATEAAIEKLVEGRGVDYGADFKLIRCTTLSGEAAPGARARARAQIFVDFLALCPHCGRLEYLSPERVGYVRDLTLWGQIKANPSYAWYHCGQCGKKWNEKQRVAALVAGAFRARAEGWQEREKDGLEPQHDPRPMRKFLDEVFPSSAAISIPSLCLPTVKLCQWAAAKIAAANDPEADHYFHNHHLDRWYKRGGGIHEVDDILRRSWGQPFGVVPSGWQCAGIYCGIDSQKGKYYYWVSAIGFSKQADGTEVRPNLWQVEAGELPSVDESGQAIPIETVLKQLEDRVYRDEMGNDSWPARLKVWNGQWRKRNGKPHKELVYLGGEYKIRMFVIDGRGNNQSNANITADAKAWCRGDMPRRRLHWGERLSAGQLFNAKFDKSAGIYIYHTDRHQLEQWVEKGLSIRPGKQGSIQVSAHCDEAHAEHLANIQVDPRTNRYVKPDTGSRDWRDCLRYSVLAYYIDCMAGVIQPV
jgi:hypothetical protein